MWLGFLKVGLFWLFGKLWPSKTVGQVKAEMQRDGLKEIARRVQKALDSRRAIKHDAGSVLNDPANRDKD